MPLDFRKSVTFVPILYLALKLSWIIAFVIVSLKESTGPNAATISWQENTQWYRVLLWLGVFCESPFDRFVLSKTLQRSDTGPLNMSLIQDFTLVLYAAIFQCQVAHFANHTHTTLLIVWALCSIAVICMESWKTFRDSPRISQGVLRFARGALCASIAAIMSSGFTISSELEYACSNISKATSLYAILCTLRCYLAAASRDSKHEAGLANITLFSCVFFMRTFAACIFVGGTVIASCVIVYAPVQMEAEKTAVENTSNVLQHPVINEAMLAQMQEMERGLGNSRRKNASMFLNA